MGPPHPEDRADALPARPRASEAGQRSINAKLWQRKDLVRFYANRNLRPVEVLLLVRYREGLSRRVLELGCGAGRLSGYLNEIASSLHGIDINASMVAACRSAYPDATFSEQDLREVSALGANRFDAVVAPFAVLDVLTHSERQAVLEGIHEVLDGDGLLILSTHNRAYESRLREPLALRNRGALRLAVTLARSPRWRRNSRRARPFEHRERNYAILNDVSHDFTALHYYISRSAQERQLAEHGFELLECLDLSGRRVDSDDDAVDSPELHYVARRRPARSAGGGTMLDVPA